MAAEDFDAVVADAGSGGSSFAMDTFTDLSGDTRVMPFSCIVIPDGTGYARVGPDNSLPVSLASVPSHAVTNAGTFAVQAAQSGTWTVDLGATDNAVLDAIAASVAGTLTVGLPTGAATAAKQPALGTAGTASADVLSVQGIASGTNLNVSLNAIDASLTVAGELMVHVGSEIFEDDVASSGQSLLAIAGVRRDTAASSSGTDGDWSTFNFDSTGRLWCNVSNTLTVASHAVTNAGTFAVQAAQSGTWTVGLSAGANSIGTLGANSGVDIGDVDVTSVIAGTGATNLGKAIDAVAGATDTGVAVLAIRDDSLSGLTPAEGDYAPLRVDSNGSLYVTGGGGGTQYNIDSVASATATGTVALVVRKDSGASLAGTDGDITGLQVDANGALRVTGGGGGTEYTEDVATPATIVGTATMMERDDALSSLTPIEGDWAAMRCDANGALWTVVSGTVTVASHAVTNAGTFAVQAAQSGTWTVDLGATDNGVLDAIAASLAGTLTVGSHAVTNAGTFAVQDSEKIADDAAFTVGTSKVSPVGFLADEASTDSVDEGDIGAARMTLDRKQIVTDLPHTAGGLAMHKTVSAASTNATSVKGSAGQLYEIMVSNVNAAARYLKLYNKATAPTVGTDTPVWTLIVPGNTAGAGIAKSIPKGLAFDTGIAFALTTEATDAGTTGVAASELVVNLGYK